MTTAVWSVEIRNASTPETPTGSYNSSTSGWEWNSTERAASPAPSHHNGLVAVIGYPGPLFTVIHVAALTSLSVSTVVIIILFIYLCGFNGSVKDHGRDTEVNGKRTASQSGGNATVANSSRWNTRTAQSTKTRISFWKWSTGERFVVYLGVCDLCQGVSHFLDHAYMYYTKDNPPDRICAVFAFFLHEFTFAQWFVILATAVSACSLVVFGRKMSLGRYDWRLIAFAFGVPTLLGVITLSLGLLGASGAWCFINLGTEEGRLYSQIVSMIQISSFGLVGVAYGAIWIKIQRTTKLMKGSTTERYQNSAKVMMIFVAAFILQWWTSTLFNIWGIFTSPPPPVLILAVIFINLGGIYNSIAYTFIRRKLQQQKPQNAVVTNHSIASNTTASSSIATVSDPRAVHVPDGSRVPQDLDIPPDVLNVPPNVLNVPPNVLDVPPDVQDVPPDVQDVPPNVLDVALDVLDVPPDVLDVPPDVHDVPPDFLYVPPDVLVVQGDVSQVTANEDRRPDSDAGEEQDAGPFQFHIHI